MWIIGAVVAHRGNLGVRRAVSAGSARGRSRFLCVATEAVHAPTGRAPTRSEHIASARSMRARVLELCQTERGEEAAHLVREMEGVGETVPTYLYNSVVIACLDQPEAARSVVDQMWSGGIRLDDGTYSTLVRAFVHWGDLGRAVRVLHRMRRAGLSMRRRTVQPLLHRLCDEGLARAAVRCWERTEESGAAFVAEDYVRMLGACCRAGELDKLPALMRRLRDGCEDRLPRALLTQVGDALRAARLPDGSAAFDATSVEMGESAIGCSHCGTHLAALRLSDAQRQSVLERLLVRAEAIDRGGALLGSLMQFDAWLKERPGYDCVIDGPNVAYDDQNYVGGRFNYYQVEDLRQQVQLAGMQPLLVMPSKYMPSNFDHAKIPNHTRRQRHVTTNLTVEELLIIEHWRQLDVVFECGVSGKDDWLWMYASLHGAGRLVVTNDEMRDHWLHLIEHRLFRRWKETQIIHFDFGRSHDPTRWDIRLCPPSAWTHASQTAPTGEWHFPCEEDDTWLCVQPRGDMGELLRAVRGPEHDGVPPAPGSADR